jgi:hypothetical protein
MTTWRTDPNLQGKFHPQFADDLQVMVHDGEPRRTNKQPEACFVRVTSVVGVLRMPHAPQNTPPPVPSSMLQWTQRPIYRGTLLNQPFGLTTVKQNQTIEFVTSPGLPHPLQISLQYAQERVKWCLEPCTGCGADQTLDPMTEMAKTRFPNLDHGSIPVAFSAFCPCGGTLALVSAEVPIAAAVLPTVEVRMTSGAKPWWKFW